MSATRAARLRSQSGFTMIELLVATVIASVILVALTSVVFTTYQADQTATSRVEASGELRNFQQVAYDDFAGSTIPTAPGGCGTSGQPCTQAAIQLSGCAMNGAGTLQQRTVSYTWTAASDTIERQVNSSTVETTASGVTAFNWYLDGTAPNQSVIVSLTVTVKAVSQSETMQFYPRVAPQLPPLVAAPC